VPPPAYERDELEFARVFAFSDGVFAIAMTLLVVGIAVPNVPEADLGDALRDRRPEIISFFVSFTVIGYYWLAHHRLFAQLKRMTRAVMMLNLVYLAAIAFLPFPTALVGKYEDAPVTVIMYAVTLAVASFVETAIFAAARRGGAMREAVPDDLYRYGLVASLLPVLVFAVSVPIALVSPSVALLSWLLVWPAERILDHWKPPGADERFH
jgi:uncharacterized membrane protein